MKPETYLRRLQKLVDHLKTGKQLHQKFNFAAFNAGPKRTRRGIRHCGTNGCAIGECPLVFPRHWKFNVFGSPITKGSRYIVESAEKFFGLTFLEVNSLFLFGIGSQNLPPTATRAEVAAHLQKFIDRKRVELKAARAAIAKAGGAK